MSLPNFKFVPLDESNYDSWSIQMKSVLVHNGVWRIVNGVVKRPVAEGETREKWISEDEKANATICLGVHPSQLGYLRDCKTSAEAWKKLEEVHRPMGPQQKVSLYKRLVNLTMSGAGGMVSHINEFGEISSKLAESGITVQEELLVIILLSSLPKDYENFVIAMETRDDLPNLTLLKQKLLEESKRRQDNSSKDEGGVQAFAAKFSKNQAKKKSTGKCWVCGQAGHYANKCHKRGKEVADSSRSMTKLAVLDVKRLNKSTWYIDSGATSHMCNERRLFVRFEDCNEEIILAGNKSIKAVGIGDVIFRTKQYEIILQNVLFSADLQANFLSINKFVLHGYTAKFNKSGATICESNGDIVIAAQRVGNMFEAVNHYAGEKVCVAEENANMVWHNRYGHLNYQNMEDLVKKGMVNGMQLNSSNNFNKCQTCMLCKIHVLKFPKESTSRSTQLLEIVHADVCGPFREKSLGGAVYFVTFIDDMSRKIFYYPLKHKSEVFEHFKLFKSNVERQTGCKIKKLRSDNGGEFVNNAFDEFLATEGITRELSVPYTPQQNGVAERANRTLVEMARAMMVHAGVKKNLWAEAVSTAVYIRNRCPTKFLQNKTPFEEWCGHKPNVKHFKIFGCLAVGLNKSGNKSKFEAKGTTYIMVGYSMRSKAYRLLDTNTNDLVEKRDVLFDEGNFPCRSPNVIKPQEDDDLISWHCAPEDDDSAHDENISSNNCGQK